MKKLLAGTLLFLGIAQMSQAQYSRYVIRFKDKAGTPYTISNPSVFLSARAVARRTRYNIGVDSTDLPVTPRYIDSIRLAGAVTILNVSKWLNSVSIQTTDAAALAKINSFSFVQAAAPIAARMANADGKVENKYQSGIQQAAGTVPSGSSSVQRTFGVTADYYNYGLSYNQVHIHNGEFLHNIGLRGQGMVIGMLDAGFQNYLTLSAYDSARANGQILGIWDFVTRDASVNEDHPHGEQCFSTIAANIPGQFVGTAPKASFYLYRSEDAATEYPIEEHNWVVAAERVDSAGGDVISSSLGYYTFTDPSFNHPFSEMNGNTTMAAIGADLAAKKGLLVAIAAGNEGANSWGRIITPADADSVMTVGAVTTTGEPASFTSRGPSADGQVKPDVVSVGVQTILQFPNGAIGGSNGTSFACPNIAGLATCLWQGFPEFNNMKIIDALRRSGSRYTNPNDTVGYGIPDVKKAVLLLLKDISSVNAAAGSVSNCKTALTWTSKDIAGMKYEIERKLPGQSTFTKIGERTGSGTTFGALHNYQYTDSLLNVQAGTISYRIRQIIDTAVATTTADYIDTITVNLAASCVATAINPATGSGEGILLLPNPTRDKVTIKIATTAAVSNLVIRIYDANGQTVSVVRTSKGSGTASYEVPVAHLAKGKYYVSVYYNNKLAETKELIKL